MGQRAKRILNAFALGTGTALLTLALVSWTDITNAVAVNDWISLKNLGVALLFGAINGGLRAIQASPAIPLPSPEPEENAPKP
jgi:hypothetical protein